MYSKIHAQELLNFIWLCFRCEFSSQYVRKCMCAVLTIHTWCKSNFYVIFTLPATGFMRWLCCVSVCAFSPCVPFKWFGTWYKRVYVKHNLPNDLGVLGRRRKNETIHIRWNDGIQNTQTHKCEHRHWYRREKNSSCLSTIVDKIRHKRKLRVINHLIFDFPPFFLRAFFHIVLRPLRHTFSISKLFDCLEIFGLLCIYFILPFVLFRLVGCIFYYALKKTIHISIGHCSSGLFWLILSFYIVFSSHSKPIWNMFTFTRSKWIQTSSTWTNNYWN